jgi:hypothetical protein
MAQTLGVGMRWAQLCGNLLETKGCLRPWKMAAALLASLVLFHSLALGQAYLSQPTFDPYATGDPFTTYQQAPLGYTGPQPYCDPGGFEFGFHAAVLEPQVASISSPLPIIGGFFSTITPEYDFEFSPRVWGGYQFPGGLGVRARWWHFDGSGSGTPLALGPIPAAGLLPAPFDSFSLAGVSFSSSIDLDAIDFELSQEGQFHNWEFEVAGGVRYAEIDFVNSLELTLTLIDDTPPNTPPDPNRVIPVAIAASSKFEGVGPTINFFARRPLGFWEGLSFVADARFAFLFGDTDVVLTTTAPIPFPATTIATVSNHAVQVWELKVGADWTRTLANGAQLHLGAFLEGQVWDWSIPAVAPGSNLGFFGPTFFVEITR